VADIKDLLALGLSQDKIVEELLVLGNENVLAKSFIVVFRKGWIFHSALLRFE